MKQLQEFIFIIINQAVLKKFRMQLTKFVYIKGKKNFFLRHIYPFIVFYCYIYTGCLKNTNVFYYLLLLLF